MKNQITKYALINSLVATAYIALVATLMSNAETLFGKQDSPISTMAFLLLFVISAAVMALTIFGRPLVWYLDGQKTEAIKLALYTIGFLAMIATITFICL